MTLVKVCGIRRIEDVEFLNELKPEYAGFVFCKSKRQINLELGSQLIEKLDKNIKRVGVFQNNSLEEVRNTAEVLKLDVIQLHGMEDENYIKELFPIRIWKSVSIDVSHDLKDDVKIKFYEGEINRICQYEVEAVLIDSGVKGSHGGTGMSFNWEILNNLNINKKVVLAGGLNFYNITQAIKIVKPYAVDISSGVEENGMKSFRKIKQFMAKVRKQDIGKEI